MTSGLPRLSVIVPAYNEATRIVAGIEHLDAFVRRQSYPCEVVIVDDCSTDDTRAIVEKAIAGKPQFRLIRHEVNQGKGGAVRTGMAQTQGTYRLFADADMSTPMEEVNRFFSFAEGGEDGNGFDVVIGSRRVAGAQVVIPQPRHREWAGRVFSLLVRALALPGFLDTQCGFKMFTARAAADIFPRQTIAGFGFDVEILYIATKRFRYRVKEAPVRWFDSPNTKVRLLRDSLMMFVDLVVIRWRDLSGRYQ